MADILATSTEAEEDTPLPSGTADKTCMVVLNIQCKILRVACVGGDKKLDCI